MSQMLQTLQELDVQEEVIAQEQGGFERIGTALKTIRDHSLYKTNYQSFDVYTTKRWDMSRRMADYLIQASEVMTMLRENNCSHLPKCESQIRCMKNLPKAQQLKVWQEVLNRHESGKRVTAALIQEVVKEMTAADQRQVPTVRLTVKEKKIVKALETLKDTQVGSLRELVFSDRGSVLNLPDKANHLLETLQLLELDYVSTDI